MKNDLYRGIPAKSPNSQYDTQCKRVLGNKNILAWILKYTCSEFAVLTIEEIVACIEGEPEIGLAKVNPGESNSDRITGDSTEDTVPEEGTVLYDIRFHVYLPGKQKRVKIIINVEAQKNFYPGYSIVTRGIFYGSRMISSQLDTEFSIPDYDSIKKVYSIWICMNAPKYIGNAIAEYKFEKEDIVPGVPDRRKEYDKISIILICLNSKTASQTKMAEMLNILLSPTMAKEEKVQRLENEFDLPMDDELEKELNIMCNLSEYVEELGIEKGLEQGLRQGFEQGIEKGLKQGIEQGLKQSKETVRRINALNLKLAQAGRTEDIIRASVDEAYQEKLLEELGM